MTGPATNFALDGPVTRIVAKLKGARKSGGSWSARCPAHEDSSPSLTVSEGRGGKAILHCHAGCPAEAIVAAVGLTMSDLFVDDERPKASGVVPIATARNASIVKSWRYTDENGRLLYETCRRPDGDARGKCVQRRPDGNGGWTWKLDDTRRVLYRLPEVLGAVKAGKRVHVTEGEKDADSLASLGLIATTSPMGAGKWRDEYGKTLAGADVVIWTDNDAPGKAHGDTVKASLLANGCSVRVVSFPDLPEHGDVSDWLATGKTLADLDARIAAAPAFGAHGLPTPGELVAGQVAGAQALLTRDLSRIVRWDCSDLDALVGAMVPGNLVIVGALPSNGKSTLLLSQMDAFAATNVPVLYIPMETDPEENRLRWATWKLGLDYRAVARQEWHQLPKGAREDIHKILSEQNQRPNIYFAPDKRVTMPRLEKWVKWGVEKAGVRVVMIDHIHRADFGVSGDYRVTITDAARQLRDIGREHGVVMIAAAHLNRVTNDSVDAYKPPAMGRIKESAAFAEEADVVLMLSRKLRRDLPDGWQKMLELGRMTEQELAERGVMVLTCRKHRLDDDARDRSVELVVSNGRVRDRWARRRAVSHPEPKPEDRGDAWEPPPEKIDGKPLTFFESKGGNA